MDQNIEALEGIKIEGNDEEETEDKPVKFPIIPTLTELALLRIAISLWDQDDIRELVSAYEFSSRKFTDRETQWKKMIESRVKDKVATLTIPESLKNNLFGTIENVSCQILLWKHCPNTIYYVSGLKKLSWTIHGSILVRYW